MAIKANETDGNLVISLEGRIDSVNAPQVEKDIFDITQDTDGETIEIDASGLEYISSAGLRARRDKSRET